VPYSLVDPGKGDPGVCGGEVEIYIEPYQPPATVLVIGCGHVGKAIADLASWLGYRVAVNDDREELVVPDEIPTADLYLPGSIDDALAIFRPTSNTFITVVTRNVMIDRQILPHLLETPAPYIGVIGSRRRWEETKRLLVEDGFNEEQLTRFHSPIGLELHAETPKEIALSIMAEIVMFRHINSGKRMISAADAVAHRIRSRILSALPCRSPTVVSIWASARRIVFVMIVLLVFDRYSVLKNHVISCRLQKQSREM
jgi:xanthine dehydrogenase accessory factor